MATGSSAAAGNDAHTSNGNGRNGAGGLTAAARAAGTAAGAATVRARGAAASVRAVGARLGERVGDRVGAVGAQLPRIAGRLRPGGGSQRTIEGDGEQELMDAREARAGRWNTLGAFGAGVAVGALLGAGTALLLAPAAGVETRVRLVRGARRAGTRVSDRWEHLGDSMRWSTERSRRALDRAVTRSRWAAEDAVERGLRQVRGKARRVTR